MCVCIIANASTIILCYMSGATKHRGSGGCCGDEQQAREREREREREKEKKEQNESSDSKESFLHLLRRKRESSNLLRRKQATATAPAFNLLDAHWCVSLTRARRAVKQVSACVREKGREREREREKTGVGLR